MSDDLKHYKSTFHCSIDVLWLLTELVQRMILISKKTMVSTPRKLGFLMRSSLCWLGVADIAGGEEVKMKF